jgi:hypothetical protein
MGSGVDVPAQRVRSSGAIRTGFNGRWKWNLRGWFAAHDDGLARAARSLHS